MVKVMQQVRAGPASGSHRSQGDALPSAAGSLTHSVLHQIQAPSGKWFAVLTAAILRRTDSGYVKLSSSFLVGKSR